MSYKVFDFFSGCGGASSGFFQTGFEAAFALDSDVDALESYRRNFPNAHIENCDIRQFDPKKLSYLLKDNQAPFVFLGCAPCQPFSRQNLKKSSEDKRINLLLEFSRIVSFWKPDFIFMENVPGMADEPELSPFKIFIKDLTRIGYEIDTKVVRSCDYGVPQKRERLILLASRHGKVSIPPPTHGPSTNQKFKTVKDYIYGLPEIAAGQKCEHDPEHVASKLSSTNIQRISCTPEGAGRESWPANLILECHKKHKGHTDVYGRLRWDSLASGLTTRCNSLSNGRFGHPTQNRAISIREAALLQTFPSAFRFNGSLNSKAKQIGNAVPPQLAKCIAEVLLEKINLHLSERKSLERNEKRCSVN